MIRDALQEHCIEAITREYPNAGYRIPITADRIFAWPGIIIDEMGVRSGLMPTGRVRGATEIRASFQPTRKGQEDWITWYNETQQYVDLIITLKDTSAAIRWHHYTPKTSDNNDVPTSNLSILKYRNIDYANPEYFTLLEEAIKSPDTTLTTQR